MSLNARMLGGPGCEAKLPKAAASGTLCADSVDPGVDSPPKIRRTRNRQGVPSPMSLIHSRSIPQATRVVARSRHALAATALLTFLITLLGCSEDGANAAESSDPAIAAVDAFIAKNPVDRTSGRWRQRLAKPPKVSFDSKRAYYWKLDTNVGEIRFKLLPDVAPMHVSSTIYLTRLGFYDSLNFHRIIKGFMAQGGDPQGNGRGNPGYRYAGEFSPDVLHDLPGTLSMANAGPNTDGSQFFITFRPTPQLNNRHTVFGRVVPGVSEKTLLAMEALGAARDPAPPTEPVFIKKATILIE